MDEQESPRPAKIRRTDQACLQCRVRKQRCLRSTPSPSTSDPPADKRKCVRCRRLIIDCSFEIADDGPDDTASTIGPTRIAQLVVELRKRVISQEDWIRRLEGSIRRESIDSTSHQRHEPGVPVSTQPQRTTPSRGGELAVDSHAAEDVSVETGLHVMEASNDAPYAFPPHIYNDDIEDDLVDGIEQPQAQYRATGRGSANPQSLLNITQMELGTPMATLSSIRNQLGNRTRYSQGLQSGSHAASSAQPRRSRSRLPMWDPINQEVLTEDDTRQAIEIFFTNCHPHAPVLDENTRLSASSLRHTCPVLFLAVCTIGCRFWTTQPSVMGRTESLITYSLHPRYTSLTALFDIAISRLLLTPTPDDVTLDSIRALLLYAQWMPLSPDPSGADNSGMARSPKSRYNDISAWAVLGLAMRYAAFLGLEGQAMIPFQSYHEETHSYNGKQVVNEVDMSRLRVWYNLLTCDFNLMLTTGLPTTLDPTSAAAAATNFSSHALAQQPSDLRVSALVELVDIAHRTVAAARIKQRKGLALSALKRLNGELDGWESKWTPKLRDTEAQYCALPFTSLRWYRLALSSSSLAPLLSPNAITATSQRISFLSALETAITSCCRILVSLSTQGSTIVWELESQDQISFHTTGNFQVDQPAISRLVFSVDYTWISITFAFTFLVMCYLKRAVDDDLQILGFSEPSPFQVVTPLPARPDSLLARLARLSSDIFNVVCNSSAVHPAKEYRAIIRSAAALITRPIPYTSGPTDPSRATHSSTSTLFEHNGETDISSSNLFTVPSTAEPVSATTFDHGDAALQSLLDMMVDNRMEWPANLMSSGTISNSGFGPSLDFPLSDFGFTGGTEDAGGS